MRTRRDVLSAFAGAVALAGCTEGNDPAGNPGETATEDDGEPTADSAEANSTGQNSVEGEANGEVATDTNSPDCATTVTIEGLGMEPNLSKGEEVCIVQYDSYKPVEDPDETGVITVETGERIGYEKLGGTGDIIRYYPDGDEESKPVIARAVRWENGSYITKGDRNSEPYPWEAPVESVIGVVRTTLE